MRRAKQRPTDRSIGVRISSSADRLNQRVLNRRPYREVTKGILKCDQYPALLMHKFNRAFAKPCAPKTGAHRFGISPEVLVGGRQHRVSLGKVGHARRSTRHTALQIVEGLLPFIGVPMAVRQVVKHECILRELFQVQLQQPQVALLLAPARLRIPVAQMLDFDVRRRD